MLVPITINIDSKKLAFFEEWAKNSEVDVQDIFAEAIDSYYELTQEQIEGIKLALKELDEGKGINGVEMFNRLRAELNVG